MDSAPLGKLLLLLRFVGDGGVVEEGGSCRSPSTTQQLTLLPPSSYGFVTFATEADAQNAIARLDKSEVAGRQINVELAKPPTATPAGRAPREPKAAAASAEGAAPIDGAVKTKKPRPKVRYARHRERRGSRS